MKKIDENYFVNSNIASQPTEIKNFVDEDEQILWQAKPKKSAYIANAFLSMLPFALIWMIFDGAFIGLMAGMGIFKQLPVWAVILICLFFVFHLIPVWFWIANILKASKGHKNLEYAFTNKRIIVKSGIIGIDFNTLYYQEIDSVNLKVGITDKLLKVGDIYVKGQSHAQVLFDLEDPYFITKRLQELVIDIKTDMEFPNEFRPTVNPGYNTKYKK